jgi:uncharacterized protein YqeY
MTGSTTEDYGWNQDMPVSLLEKLREDLKKSMRNKDPQVRDTIRLIMGEFPKLTVPITLESGKKTTRVKKAEEITDDEVVGIVQGLVKSERIVLEAKREESSEYLAILQHYLPKMATEQDIVAWIDQNIDFSEYKNKMQAMGAIMKHFGKRADGKMVNEILKNWS